MPREVHISFSTLIAVVVAVLTGSAYVHSRFESFADLISNLDTTVAVHDVKINKHEREIALMNDRMYWLYSKSIGIEVPNQWPRNEGTGVTGDQM